MQPFGYRKYDYHLLAPMGFDNHNNDSGYQQPTYSSIYGMVKYESRTSVAQHGRNMLSFECSNHSGLYAGLPTASRTDTFSFEEP